MSSSIADTPAGEVVQGTIEPAPDMSASMVDRVGHAVAIFGAGPAGLLAAHAVALAGRTPLIFSASANEGYGVEKSKISGATYLHAPIPDVTRAVPDNQVRFKKIGTQGGYAQKVYGDRNATCSWDKFEDDTLRDAWSLSQVYDDLWERYRSQIVPYELNFEAAEAMIDLYPLVVSTIPAPALCQGKCKFESRSVWIEPTHREFCEQIGDPVVIYNGLSEFRYSRTSLLFGHGATEWPELPERYEDKPGRYDPDSAREDDWVEGTKPTANHCDCLPEIVRAGRFGEWKPGVLTHHAFEKVWGLMFDAFEGA